MLVLARIAVLVALAALLLATPAAAFGYAGDGEPLAGDAPAVEAPDEEVDEEDQPWTARYLAPATLLLGLVAVGGSVLYYGVRVRGRYRVTS